VVSLTGKLTLTLNQRVASPGRPASSSPDVGCTRCPGEHAGFWGSPYPQARSNPTRVVEVPRGHLVHEHRLAVGFAVEIVMRRRRRQRYHQQLDPAIRAAIARAAGKYGGRIGGPARALRLTPLERSRIAMQGGRARAASMTTEERSAWAHYMLQHQRRFWDGRTHPRKPVRARDSERVVSRVPDITTAKPVTSPHPTALLLPSAIPVIVIPRRTAVVEVIRPGMRYDV
jgi:hypothetical protein